MLTTKHDDPNGKLGWGERLAYGSGGFAFNMINGIIGSFLTIYFTSAAGLNAGIIATILAVSKAFDGISDLIMGRLVDNTNTKMGKARVWLLRMCIPFAVSTMLLFYVPAGFPDMVKYVYVFLIYNICNAVCLTGMLVPFYSMVGLVTENSYERGLLGNIQQIFQTLGNVFDGPDAMLNSFPDWKRIDIVTTLADLLEKYIYLHMHNIVAGDIQMKNALIYSSKSIYLIDMDSVQVDNLPCPVGTEEFTDPRLWGKDFASFIRKLEDEDY